MNKPTAKTEKWIAGNEKVQALSHTQNAFDVLDGIVMKTAEIAEMLNNLQAVRKELAYEIFREK